MISTKSTYGNILEDRALAFLDLLGFKHYVRENHEGARLLLDNTHQLINTALIDEKTHPPDSYPNKRLAELAEQNLVTGFEYLIPFSDSLVVISNEPNIMVKQLSSLLVSWFTYTAGAYQNVKKGEDPTKIRIHVVTPDGPKDDLEENWYPTLFRGGLAFGDVAVDPGLQIWDYKQQPARLASGIPLIEAYQLESCGIKGPRLLCSDAFRASLNEDTSKYVVPACEGISYEVLWPAFMYIDDNTPEIELNDFVKLYCPAETLWKSYRSRPYSEHYLQFLVLIIRSTLEFFKHKNRYDQAKSFIAEKIKEKELFWILERF